jgi:hypothetical protein
MTPQYTHVHFDTQYSTKKEGCPPGKNPEVLAPHLEDPDDAPNANSMAKCTHVGFNTQHSARLKTLRTQMTPK